MRVCLPPSSSLLEKNDMTMTPRRGQVSEATRQARAELGNNPLAIAIAGWPWSPLQYAAFGAQYTYGACRDRHEQTYAFVRHPFDGVGQLVREKDADTGTIITTMRVLPRATANAHFRVDSDARGLCFMKRLGPEKDLVAKRFVNAWFTDPNARTLDAVVFDPSKAPGYNPPPCGGGGPR